MILHAFTDGASRGNPGESGIGILIMTEEGEILLTASGYIGVATNNIAEYTALVAMLRRARRLRCTRMIAHSDSELMVRQMRGEYKVKDENLRKQHAKAASLLDELPFPCELRHVPREQNREADRLANLAIETRRRIRV
ncbi:MAG: ribonuclease HI family protein [Bacteroidota bacterium]